MKKKINYIDNSILLEEFKKYKKLCKEAEEQGKPRPKLPDSIGRAILLIAVKLNSASRFMNYTYRDEMISDGIEHCIKYVHNFDPDRFSSPYSYISMICHNASLRRIEAEKKQVAIKSALLKNSSTLDMFLTSQDHDTCVYENSYIKYLLEFDDQKSKDNIPRKPGRKPKSKIPPKEIELITPETFEDDFEENLDDFDESLKKQYYEDEE
jgi:hypothetical protein